MGQIITYRHHEVVVSVDRDNQGKHRDNCLCHRNCLYFKPNTSDNCSIAQSLFDICVQSNVVTPVWECAKYKSRKYDRGAA